jgi:hypothetical protein
MDAQSPQRAVSTASFSTAFVQLWRMHPAAVVAAGALLVAAGVVSAWLFGKIALGGTGDEPPIRVRGGSIDLQLVGIEGLFIGDWDHKTDHWEVNGGKKGQLGVAVRTDGSVCLPVFADVKKVTFGFTPKTGTTTGPAIDDYLTIDPSNQKTKVTVSNTAPTPTHTGRLLDYAVTGFISSITIQGPTGPPQRYDFAEGVFKEAILY